MKLLLLFLWLAAPLCAFSDDSSSLKALRSADDSRVEALRSPEAGKLEAILSDALRYAHSNGAVDTKASFIDLLLSGKSKYLNFDYQERNFSFPAPGIALMSGRANVKLATPTAEMDVLLSFLAVWREENGHWRFLAWQSCKLPPTPAP